MTGGKTRAAILADARLMAVVRAGEWSGTDHPDSYHVLADALGFESYNQLLKTHIKTGPASAELHRKLLMLGGEHGYVVWKALVAQKEGS